MPTAQIRSRIIEASATIVPLTTVQRALWHLVTPILDAGAVARYKKRAQRGMLWRAICWQLLGMAALVAFICLGRQWERAAAVGAAAVVLAFLFGWLVNSSELQWQTLDYRTYQSSNPIPPHVSAAANALLRCGVSEQQIGIEYLKNDPILFVEDAEALSGVKRYDLVIW